MPRVYEWFGYPVADSSPAAAASAAAGLCPIVGGDCVKKKSGGVCSVVMGAEIVTVCPVRLYFDQYKMLRDVAAEAFVDLNVQVSGDGLPSLVPGRDARAEAAQSGQTHVGVFGKGWGAGSGEVKLPPAMAESRGGYSVDYTLAAISSTGVLEAFAPVEVQAIDISNSYSVSVAALKSGRQDVASSFGMNWENVNKRILPQLITKGLMLQAERLCKSGIYFATPEPVFQRIIRRIGGIDRLRPIHQQPASITFLRYEQDRAAHVQGTPVPMRRLEPVTISVSDMSIAFISPQNLPGPGSYEQRLRNRIRRS